MLKTLLKKQLTELTQSLFLEKKTGKARTGKGTVFTLLLTSVLALFLAFSFFEICRQIASALLGNGFDWMYFVLEALLAMALGVFGSVFSTYGSLYLPKDNELMLSLPVPLGTLLVSRLAGVFLSGLAFTAWIWIPAVIAAKLFLPSLGLLLPLLLTLVLALFVTFLSCVLGWLVALGAKKLKGKSYVKTLLALAVLAVYYVVYFKFINSIGTLATTLGPLGGKVKSSLKFLYHTGLAATGRFSSFLLVAGITATLMLITFFVLKKTFLKLVTGGTDAGSKKKAKVEGYTERTAARAMLRREFSHFASLTTWMLNGGLGILMLYAGAVIVLVKAEPVKTFLYPLAFTFPELPSLLPLAVFALTALILATIGITPVSVSMEGKNMWILQSLPVTGYEILRVKEKTAVLLMAPAGVLFAAASSFVLGLNLKAGALVCLDAVLAAVLMADFGLYLNLKKPNLAWTNPAYLTKQSMPVVITMFGGWAFAALLGFAGYELVTHSVPFMAVLIGYALVMAILCAVLRKWFRTKGAEVLMNL